jgi:hypothetical protein
VNDLLDLCHLELPDKRSICNQVYLLQYGLEPSRHGGQKILNIFLHVALNNNESPDPFKRPDTTNAEEGTVTRKAQL